MNNDQIPGNIPEIEEQVIDLRLYLNILRKRYPLIILVTLLCVIVSGLISFFILKPVYETHTTLLVTQATDKQQTAGTQSGDLNTLVDSMSRIPVLTMNTYIGELKSDAMMQNVIKKLRLEESGYSTRDLARSIKASVAKDSNLIDVTVNNGDPDLAVDMANTLSQEFLEFISKNNKEQMQRSVEFMKGQTDVTDGQLEKAVAELTRFDSEPRGVTYLQKDLSARLQDLNNYQSELTRAKVEMQQLSASVDLFKESMLTTPKTITVQKYDQAQGITVFSEEINPAYASLADKLDDKSAALAEKRAQLAAIQGVLGSLKTQIDQIQAELTDKKAQQDLLTAEVQRLQETRKLLADKTTQTQIARSIDLGSTSVLIVSPAISPASQVKPDKMLNMAIAFLLGLMASVALAFMLEFLDNTIKKPEDVAQHLGLSVIGIIPSADSRSGYYSNYYHK